MTNALSESINAKIEKVKRMACGFRNQAHYRMGQTNKPPSQIPGLMESGSFTHID
ncbi:MAG: transposase [Chitinivibrionales bacterium]|nr:transposase [Chitinivibrionales bacterium]